MRHAILAVAALVAILVVYSQPRVAQSPGYHRMADERTLVGVPNALNVLSNAAFAVVGLFGLYVTGRSRWALEDRGTRWAYVALFTSVVLTAFGSSYYHLAPDNARLVWDRLPMAAGFMGLFSAVIAERVNWRLGQRLLMPLVMAGIASVVYWNWTETRGAGDLRPYTLTQYGSLLLIVLILILYPARRYGTAFLIAALAGYGVAKLAELADATVFAAGHMVSGHTLKHVVAAAAVGCIGVMLQQRGSVERRSAL